MSLPISPHHEYFTWGRFTWDVTEVWRVVEKRGFHLVEATTLAQGNSLIRINHAYAMSDAIDLDRLDVLLGHYMPSAGWTEKAYVRSTGLPEAWTKTYAIILDGHHKLERALHEKRKHVRLYSATFEETLAAQIEGPRPMKAQLKRLATVATIPS